MIIEKLSPAQRLIPTGKRRNMQRTKATMQVKTSVYNDQYYKTKKKKISTKRARKRLICPANKKAITNPKTGVITCVNLHKVARKVY